MQGITPGVAAISTAASSTLSLPLTVTSEPTCLVQLHTAATTGATVSPAVTGANSSSSSSIQPVSPSQEVLLNWQARQDLVWEDSTALVLSYARFSDGSVMDVTDKTAVTAAVPAGAGSNAVLPFSLSTDNTTGLQWLRVTSLVSLARDCVPQS